MRLMRPYNNALYCYACGAYYDIFSAANKLEGKPLSGKAFIEDNVNYLCDKFGVPRIEITLTEQDLKELDCERVHRVAGTLFRGRAKQKASSVRGWTDTDRLRQLGVGTIEDRDDFMTSLAKETQLTVDEIEGHGIKRWFFGPDKLTFILSDINDQTIGFAARDLNYESKVANGQKDARKYVNPDYENNKIFKKSSYLYNLGIAKKAKRGLIMEGYADVITCELAGVKGAVAICGTAFSEEKANNLIKAGIRDVIICLDYDFGKSTAGQNGTLRAVDVLRGFPEIRVRVLNWPKIINDLKKEFPKEDKFDVDFIIQEKGTAFFEELLNHSISPIVFKLKELQSSGMDGPTIAKEIIPDIASTANPLDVEEQVEQVAAITGIDRDLILEAVKQERRLRDRDKIKELDSAFKEAEYRFKTAQDIDSKITAITELESEIRGLDPRGLIVSTEYELQQLEKIEFKTDNIAVGKNLIRTGIEDIDNDLGGGIPSEEAIFMIGGHSQMGKTMLQIRMLVNTLRLNQDPEVIFWTLDDPKDKCYQRMWCAVSGLPLYKCMRPSFYLKDNSMELDKFNKAREIVKNWVRSGRLTVWDGSNGNHIEVLERLVDSNRRRSQAPLMIFFDNIHKTKNSADRKTLEQTSERLKNITQQTGASVVVNAEFRKQEGQETERPREPTDGDLKETGKLFYDADYCLLLDNPMVRMPYRPDALTSNNKPYKSYKDYPNTCWQRNTDNKDLAVLWGHRKKNKIFDVDGNPIKKLYFKFDPTYIEFSKYEPTMDRILDLDFESTRLE